MKAEDTTKEPVANFSKLGAKGDAPEAPMGYGQEITHVLMSSGQWIEILPKSFHLYKTKEGVPFIEYKAYLGIIDTQGNQPFKTVQVFPASISGWAFDEQ